MTHTITIDKAILLHKELEKLVNKSMPLRASYHLGKLFEQLKVEKNKLNDFIQPYFSIEKWGELQEDGQLRIKQEFIQEYLILVNEYLSIEIEIVFKNEFELFEKIELSIDEYFPIFYSLLDAE
jgi:hypothetical protein